MTDNERITLNPSILGQAEKAHNALLFRILAGTGVDEVQWISLQLALGSGGVANHAELVARVSSAAKFAPVTVEAAVAALVGAGLFEQNGPGHLAVTEDGREFVDHVRGATAPVVARAYSGVPAEDLAIAGRVLTEITARFDAELAAF
ncbi:MAG TPA: hypothetical protein VKQ07_08205 [Jatrophihabitantaceae bacterium]|nr:hypothetical protein [Jatrophihabitantaceae bacterium]